MFIQLIACKVNARIVDHATLLMDVADSQGQKAPVLHGKLRYDYFNMQGEDGKHSVETTHKHVEKGSKDETILIPFNLYLLDVCGSGFAGICKFAESNYIWR